MGRWGIKAKEDLGGCVEGGTRLFEGGSVDEADAGHGGFVVAKDLSDGMEAKLREAFGIAGVAGGVRVSGSSIAGIASVASVVAAVGRGVVGCVCGDDGSDLDGEVAKGRGSAQQSGELPEDIAMVVGDVVAVARKEERAEHLKGAVGLDLVEGEGGLSGGWAAVVGGSGCGGGSSSIKAGGSGVRNRESGSVAGACFVLEGAKVKDIGDLIVVGVAGEELEVVGDLLSEGSLSLEGGAGDTVLFDQVVVGATKGLGREGGDLDLFGFDAKLEQVVLEGVEALLGEERGVGFVGFGASA